LHYEILSAKINMLWACRQQV